jgi:ATP-dependent Lon protease
MRPQSSLIVQTIARKKIGNPIFILDEIDKASERGHNGSVWDTLHLLTERATSCRFFDDYLYSECDLSQVSYIATANSLARIPKSLLSRFRIALVPNPSVCDASAIELGVRESFAKALDIDPRFLPLLEQDEFQRFSGLVGQSLRTAQRFYTDQLIEKIESNVENAICH